LSLRSSGSRFLLGSRRPTCACTGREPLLYCPPRFSLHRVAVHAGEAETLGAPDRNRESWTNRFCYIDQRKHALCVRPQRSSMNIDAQRVVRAGTPSSGFVVNRHLTLPFTLRLSGPLVSAQDTHLFSKRR
jgi:hypothetical protein